MKNKVVLFVVFLSAYYPKATTNAETVWLTDVTKKVYANKRTISKHDLPDQLSFRLQYKSHALTLHLKRNHLIDPNTDIYIVQKLKDGQPILERKENLEKEGNLKIDVLTALKTDETVQMDVAYYQDIENGAFMTARCVERSRGQCDIIINGNIRIGDGSYDLRPSVSDVTPSDFLEIAGLRGKRYVLQEQANIQSGMLFENNDETSIETHVEDKLINRLQRIPYEQDKHIKFPHPDVRFPTRNVSRLKNPLPTEEIMNGRINTKNDKTRNIKYYHVDVLVLADSGTWELFLSMAHSLPNCPKATVAMRNIREYLLHIMNGVDMLYKGIDDPSIRISVNIRAFGILTSEQFFPHNESKVEMYNGHSVIEGDKYLDDLKSWDINIGSKQYPSYDQVILFTRHVLYVGSIDYPNCDGCAVKAGVCDIGRRAEVVRVMDYFKTTTTTAHELGHALGADHDGEGDATSCSSADYFIMSSYTPILTPGQEHTENVRLFSKCSVESFKRTLVNKWCLATKHVHAQDILDEQKQILMKQLGERYTLNEQCQIIYGVRSFYCGTDLSKICRDISCMNPKVNQCEDRLFNAFPGTTCGDNMWCQKELCVPKPTRGSFKR